MVEAEGQGNAIAGMLEALLDVSARDPVWLAAAALFLVGVVLVACYLPARRAAAGDPLMAPRHD